MSEITVRSLDNVVETLLIPLYIRAIESQRPDALLKDVERWGDGICLLDEWFSLDSYEPRLAAQQRMRHIPLLAKAAGILHYWLGTATR